MLKRGVTNQKFLVYILSFLIVGIVLVIAVGQLLLPGEQISQLKGDFNNDCKVNLDDFFEFTGAFNSNQAKYDLDSSGKVNFDDFFIFSENFGKECEENVATKPVVGLAKVEDITALDFNKDSCVDNKDLEIANNEIKALYDAMDAKSLEVPASKSEKMQLIADYETAFGERYSE